MALRKTNGQDYNNKISDISVDVICISESNLRVILMKNIDKLSKNCDIIGAIALFLSLGIVLITAEFKSKWLDSNTWYGIFIVLTIAASAYLIYVINNNRKNKVDEDVILDEIKKSREVALTTLRPQPISAKPKNKTQKKKRK